MRTARTFALALVVSLAGCASMHQDVETLFLPDPETWHQVSAVDDGRNTLVELAPEGQTLANWRELCSIGLKADDGAPRALQATLHELETKMHGHGGHVTWNVIEETPESVLYEWTIAGAPNEQDQGEIARLVRGREGLLRAAYAHRYLPLPAERRAQWIGILRRARPVKNAQELDAAIAELMPETRTQR
jgi:hypothetical protein